MKESPFVNEASRSADLELRPASVASVYKRCDRSRTHLKRQETEMKRYKNKPTNKESEF